MSWTDERIATLKKMWKEGKSAADIAKTLGKGVTRNAVIGKAHRMGLSGRPSPIKKPPAPAKKEPAKKAPAAKAPAPAAKKAAPAPAPAKSNAAAQHDTTPARPPVKEVFPADGGVPLIDLTERMCKWPFGDPKEDDFTFCGRAIRPGTPYCPEHAALAYQSSSRSRPVAPAEEKVVDEGTDDEDSIGVA